ncbi:MAG: hypothetical protein AAFU73_23565 [Planctomycetota bacterium]
MLLASMALAHFASGANSAIQSSRQRDQASLVSGAESVIDLAAARLWNAFVDASGGEPGTMGSMRTFLDLEGIAADAGTGRPPAAAGTDVSGTIGFGASATGSGAVDGAVVDELRIVRRDVDDVTHLYFTAVARPVRGERLDLPGRRRVVQKVYAVDNEPWSGLDYALLANNIDCVFCHATVDNAARVFNSDSSLAGTFERVKVGSLDSLRLRTSSNTTIYGTLYTRGAASDTNGNPIRDWGSMNVKSVAFDAQGRIAEDSLGHTTRTDFVPAGDPPAAFANLYLDYDTDAAAQVDGYLPETFPELFPDDGGIDPVTGDPTAVGAGNRQIDPGEFAEVAARSDGSIAGGSIHVNDGSATLQTTTELRGALETGNRTSLPPVVDGDVVLIGTRDDPIQLNGQVTVDGDVVIQGYVRGEGSILASGNLYLPGNVQYVDGESGGQRTFGVAPDGSRNALALAAGGSIVAGDLYRGKDASRITGDESGEFGFVHREISTFNRREWAKTQPYLRGRYDVAEPWGWTVENPNYAGPDYVPRYFSFAEDGKIPIFNRSSLYYDADEDVWVGPEGVGSWDPGSLTIADPTDPTDPVLYDAGGAPKAVVQSLTTRDDWIARDTLVALMRDRLAEHPSGEPLEIDALLYSSNSIFGLVKRSSSMDGRMTVNGGVVAPDLGLLAASGFRVNYDERLSSELELAGDTQRVRMRARLWLGEVAQN